MDIHIPVKQFAKKLPLHSMVLPGNPGQYIFSSSHWMAGLAVESHISGASIIPNVFQPSISVTGIFSSWLEQMEMNGLMPRKYLPKLFTLSCLHKLQAQNNRFKWIVVCLNVQWVFGFRERYWYVQMDL